MKENAEPPQSKPTLRQAIGWCVFAVLFGLVSWLEHRWRISRGDYPGPFLSHTWYWYVTNWTAIGFLAGLGIWKLIRWTRDRD